VLIKSKFSKLFVCMLIFAVVLGLSIFAAEISAGEVSTSSVLNFRSAPSTSSDIIGKLSNKTKVAVLDDNGEGWYKIAYMGKTGYASSDYIKKITTDEQFDIGDGVVSTSSSSLNFRSAPSTSSSRISSLPNGTVVSIVGIKDGWFVAKYGSSVGYVHPDYIKITKDTSTVSRGASPSADSSSAPASDGSVSDKRAALISFAKQYLGVKYKAGGASPSGFDCSGFTYYVFKNSAGITLNRSSASQYTNCTPIKKSELIPGDLVFFANPRASKSRIGHVGIYIGNGQFIHSTSPGDVVSITNLSDSYYTKYYKASGRVPGLD